METDSLRARDRLLAAARTLGLPLPEALVHAPLADATATVRELAVARIRVVDAQISDLERERGLLAASATHSPPGDA